MKIYLLAQEEEGIALKLVVKKVTVKIMGHMTALNHERFASDSYDMLGAEQRHKWGLTAAGSKVNTCCPFLLPTVMMDSGFAHCSFGFAGCFRLRHCVPDLHHRESHLFTGDRKHVLVIKGNVTTMVGQEFTRKRPSRRRGPDWTQ